MPEQIHKKTYKLGVISDTHGLLRPAVIKTLEDCDYIVHAGDVDRPSVLETLETLAPVAVVRGNNDCGFWAAHLREWIDFTVGGVRILLIHNKAHLPAPLPETGYGDFWSFPSVFL